MKLLFTVVGLGRTTNLGVRLGCFMLESLLDRHVEMLSGSVKLRGEALAAD